MDEMDKKYTYFIANTNESTEITVSIKPEEFLHVVSDFLKVLGWDDIKKIPVTIYAQAREDALWYPIFGAKDTYPTLFPFAPDPVPILDEKEYRDIGRKIFDCYMKRRERFAMLRSSRSSQDKNIHDLINKLEGDLRVVEQVVTGTELEPLFNLKYKHMYSIEACVVKLHFGKRSIDRRVNLMQIYVAKTLHTTLSPRKLKELTDDGA